MKTTNFLFSLILFSLSFFNLAIANESKVIYHYEVPSPFCVAISKGDLQTVKKMIEYGADINEKTNGMTPLMFAARYNQVEVVKILLEKGADVTTKDDKGRTALQYAEISNAREVVSLLKNK